VAQTRAVAPSEPHDGADEFEDAATVPRWRPLAAIVLSLLGFGVSMYLTVEHYTGGILTCPAGGGAIDCTKVTSSAQSKLFGAPVALLGLLFFTAMIVLNLPPLWRASARRLAQVRLAMVVGGMGFVVYLLSAELFSIKAICLWCTSVHIVTFLLFILVVMSYPAMAGGRPVWDDDGEDLGAEPG
jgi:uncharacterized membrane protein